MTTSLRIAAVGLAALGMVVVGGMALRPRVDPGAAPSPAATSTLIGLDVAPAGDIDTLIDVLEERATRRLAPEELTALGAAYLQKARSTADPAFYDLSARALGAALEKQPEHLPALLGSGELSLALHDFRRALSLGRTAARIDPFSATALGIVGDAQVELGRYAAAFASYQRMIDLRPNLSSFARVSYARELTGDVEGSIVAMRSALEAGAFLPEGRAWTYNQLGDLHFSSGNLDAAERAYRSARATDAEFVPALAGLARVDAARGKFDSAESCLTQVVDRMPLVQYVVTLGDVQWARGKRAEATQTYELARAQGKLAAVGGVLPDVELTIFLADQGRKRQLALSMARDQYRERASIRTADALAWALYRNGRSERAERFASEALRLGTRDATLHYHAGMIASENGRPGVARRHLEAALDINPYFSFRYAREASRLLDRLGARS